MSTQEFRNKLYDIDLRLADALRYLKDQQTCICNIEGGEYDSVLRKLFRCLLDDFRKLEAWRNLIVVGMVNSEKKTQFADASRILQSHAAKVKKSVGHWRRQ